ncbi:hypothetical protein T492DRAFT_222975 [Pavlovales sp. CCMP2436]|nr:hypothetical protein T492DRAFT_222975 [Pavlovales sp. CCMP2436]
MAGSGDNGDDGSRGGDSGGDDGDDGGDDSGDTIGGGGGTQPIACVPRVVGTPCRPPRDGDVRLQPTSAEEAAGLGNGGPSGIALLYNRARGGWQLLCTGKKAEEAKAAGDVACRQLGYSGATEATMAALLPLLSTAAKAMAVSNGALQPQRRWQLPTMAVCRELAQRRCKI